MIPRLTRAGVRAVAHHLGALAQLLAACMAAPTLVAVASSEWEPAARYLLSSGLCLVVGAALRFAALEKPRLDRTQAIAVTGIAWVFLSLLAAVPLWLSGHFGGYFDALFECVSALTTTGVSLAQDLPHLSNADNTWRFALQLVGGLGFIVVALSLGLFGRRIDASLYTSEGRSERFIPQVAETARFIARTTLAIVVGAAVALGFLCLAAGMETGRAALHGVWLSIAAFATGGFAPMPSSVTYYHSFAIEIALMVTMLLGALNFALLLGARRGRIDEIGRDSEVRTGAIWIAAMTALFTVAACGSATFSDTSTLLRQGTFTIISTLTTTGFQTLSTNQLMQVLPSGALLVLVLLMAVGGCAGSTAGGLKLHRLSIVVKSISVACRKALVPESARMAAEYHHFGRRTLDDNVSKEAMTVFVLFTATCALGALAGVAHGQDGLTAIVDSVAMTSNGGVFSGIVSCDMPASLEFVYLVQMLAGRLEFVTFAAIVIEIVASIVPHRRMPHGQRSASAPHAGGDRSRP